MFNLCAVRPPDRINTLDESDFYRPAK